MEENELLWTYLSKTVEFDLKYSQQAPEALRV